MILQEPISPSSLNFNIQHYNFFCNPSKPQSFVMLKNLDLLVNKIRKNQQQVLPNFFFIQSKKEQASFIQSVLRAMIDHKTDDDIMIERFLSLAKLYSEDSETQSQINEFEEDISTLNLVFQYTRDTFFHKLLNSLLRTGEGPFELYYGQYFVKYLFNKIKSICAEYKLKTKKNSHSSAIVIRMFKNNKGKLIQTLGFLSTTKIQQKAYTFSPNVIIQIKVQNAERQEGIDYGYAHLEKELTDFPSEQQVLFNVLILFQIESVQVAQDPGEFTRIKLIYGKNSNIVHKYLIHQKLNAKQKEIHDLLQTQNMIDNVSLHVGQIIGKFNEQENYFQEVEAYFSELFQIYEEDQVEDYKQLREMFQIKMHLKRKEFGQAEKFMSKLLAKKSTISTESKLSILSFRDNYLYLGTSIFKIFINGKPSQNQHLIKQLLHLVEEMKEKMNSMPLATDFHKSLFTQLLLYKNYLLLNEEINIIN